jgi:hypothetical protein
LDKLAAIKNGDKAAVSQGGDLVEIVALPREPGVKVNPIVLNGEKAPMEKDEDGFWHFWVKRENAGLLLTGSFGIRFALVGPDDKLVVRRTTVLRHVKQAYKTGGVRWVPVVEEESGDDDVA